jgi:hypothetical protein
MEKGLGLIWFMDDLTQPVSTAKNELLLYYGPHLVKTIKDVSE